MSEFSERRIADLEARLSAAEQERDEQTERAETFRRLVEQFTPMGKEATEVILRLEARVEADERERDEWKRIQHEFKIQAERQTALAEAEHDARLTAVARAEAADRLLKEWLDGGLYGLSNTIDARTEAALAGREETGGG